MEQLLVHTSGLPAATAISDYGDGPSAMRKLGDKLEGKLKTEPGDARRS